MVFRRDIQAELALGSALAINSGGLVQCDLCAGAYGAQRRPRHLGRSTAPSNTIVRTPAAKRGSESADAPPTSRSTSRDGISLPPAQTRRVVAG